MGISKNKNNDNNVNIRVNFHLPSQLGDRYFDFGL